MSINVMIGAKQICGNLGLSGLVTNWLDRARTDALKEYFQSQPSVVHLVRRTVE